MPQPHDLTKARVLAAIALATTAFVLLLPLPRGFEGGWRGPLLSLGHVPLFALLTLALWPACGRRWLPPTLLSLALAGLTEIGQPFVGRSGDLADFLRGAAGVLAAGSLLRAAGGRRSRGCVAAHGLVALALIALPVAEVGPTLVDAAEGVLDFPTLADFAAPRRLGRWDCVQAGLRRVRGRNRQDAFAGRITFHPGPSPYPSVTLRHITRDFRGYRRLCWAFTVEGGPITLVFSLRGGPDGAGVTGHHQFEQTFAPGDHMARMDLPEAALLAQTRQLDIGDLWWSQLFVVRPNEPRVIDLWRVWLE